MRGKDPSAEVLNAVTTAVLYLELKDKIEKTARSKLSNI
ncbi:MAG: hypothetical protein ACJA0N_002215 [Pseudohongiellaceae bacterium]|jgi:hypothetical protein